MDVPTEFRFQYEDEEPRTVRLKSNFSARSLAALRKLLITQCAPTMDLAPNLWRFYVNGQLISPMDAANRTIGSISADHLVQLQRKSSAPTPIVRVPKRPREQEEELRTYDLGARLLRIVRQDQAAFRSERESNGLAHRNVIGILGHIQQNLRGIQTPVPIHQIVMNTDVIQTMAWIGQNTQRNVAISPFFVPNHVSLLCAYGPNRLLHLDASHSLRPINREVFEAQKRFKTVSFTFVNYQMYDETNVDANLAGGNCAMFTGLAAVSCILRYRATSVRFREFYRLFEAVAKRTPPQQAAQLRRRTMSNVLYMAEGETALCGAELVQFPMPPAELTWEHFEMMLLAKHEQWIRRQDFISDFLMLSLFEDTSLGFHQTALLGNVFRVMLKDIVERGFISFRISCVVCGNIATGQCSHCDLLYCGQACMDH